MPRMRHGESKAWEMSLNGEYEARKSTFRQILRVTASTEGKLANEKVRKKICADPAAWKASELRAWEVRASVSG